MRYAIGLMVALVAGCGASQEEPPPQVPPPPSFVPEGAEETSAATYPPSFSTIPPASATAATPPPATSSSTSAAPLPPLSSSANPAGPLPPLPSKTPPPASTIIVEQAPPETKWVYSYPTGQWVYVAGNGWVWIPADGDVVEDDGVPYVYLYTPSYGWTWYVSPWGYGPYHYGIWVRHPWRPSGWRGHWVAPPHVIVHLGGHPRFHPHPSGPRPHGGGHHR